MTGAEPFFSIVVPLYDKQAHIGRTLECVAEQSFGNYELIVVDDGSRDRGPDLVRAWKDARLEFIQQANAGVSAARNRGARAARGQWIAFLDADDLWASEHLEQLRRVIDAFPEASLVGTAFRKIGGEVQEFAPAGEGELSRINYLREIAQGEPPFFTSSLAIERETFVQSGGFGPHPIGEDRELVARLALTNEFAASRRVTAGYRQDTGGIMDRAGKRWRADALSTAGDIAPAVRTVLAYRETAGSPSMRRDIDGFVNRYVGYVASSAIVTEDPRLLKAASRLYRPVPRGRDRVYRMLGRLPLPVIKASFAARSYLTRHRRAATASIRPNP